MFCPNCGSQTEETQNFCNRCGHSYEKNNIHPKEKAPPLQTKRRSWFYFIFLGTFLLTLWGFYSLFFGFDELEAIARSQLQEIQKNQITKAYYEYSSTQFKNNSSLEAFRNFINKNPSLKEFSQINFKNVQRENNYGVILGELTDNNNISIPIKYEFIREDGEWRILKIDLEQPIMTAQPKNIEEDEAIVTSVTGQLQALKLGQIKKAYEQFSSQDFVSSTPYKSFEKFIKSYPIITDFDNVELIGFDQTKDKAKINLMLYSKKNPLNLEYSLINEKGDWKIWSMQVIKESDNPEEKDNVITQPIANFIQILNRGDLKAAYDSTSQKFKQTTTLERFESFINRFPDVKNSDIDFLKISKDKNLGLVKIESKNNGTSTLIDYTLAREGDGWKILGIEIIDHAIAKPKAEENTEPFDKSSLIKIIQEQLTKIREKDFYSAYEKYSSTEFKAATSFEIFAKFIDQNPIYNNNHSGKFNDLSFENNIATLKGTLFSKKGEQAAVEYDFIKENNTWKILGIKIITNAKEKEDSSEQKIKEII